MNATSLGMKMIATCMIIAGGMMQLMPRVNASMVMTARLNA
jgi:hypothetical protein